MPQFGSSPAFALNIPLKYPYQDIRWFQMFLQNPQRVWLNTTYTETINASFELFHELEHEDQGEIHAWEVI